jgi:hypothetical protein
MSISGTLFLWQVVVLFLPLILLLRWILRDIRKSWGTGDIPARILIVLVLPTGCIFFLWVWAEVITTIEGRPLTIIVVSQLLIYRFIVNMRQKNPNAVQTVFYFFFLAAFSTCLVANWAIGSNYIDDQFKAHGQWADVIDAALRMSQDLDGEFIVMLIVASIVVIPQLMTYVVCGFFGAASKPILISYSMRFLVWGTVKSLSVTSGITLSLALIANLYGFKTWAAEHTIRWIENSHISLSAAFLVLHLYCNPWKSSSYLDRLRENKAARAIQTLHQFASRFRR